MKIEEVRKKFEQTLFEKANVVGVMTGYKIREMVKTNVLSIICMVEKKNRKRRT